MNILAPQSLQTRAEAEILTSTAGLIKSGQGARLLLTICQDALNGGYLATRGTEKNPRVAIKQSTWNDAVCSVEDWSMEYISKKQEEMRTVYAWQKQDPDIYHGHGLLSMCFPSGFEYNSNNVVVISGVVISGCFNKSVVVGSSSVVHKIEKDYGAQAAVDFVSNYQFVVNHWLKCRGFTIGIADCIADSAQHIQNEITKSFMEAQASSVTETNLIRQEQKINNALNNATSIGQVISKNGLSQDNNLNIMVLSGAKGGFVNITQITGLLGQQNIDGRRVVANCGGRTLPHYSHDTTIREGLSSEELTRDLTSLYESRGFVSGNYIRGLNVREFFHHAGAGRVGIIDTGLRTAQSGYIQRKLVKKLENYKVAYSGLITDSNENVLQFNYEDNIDPARKVWANGKKTFVNATSLIDQLNHEVELQEFKKS